MRAAAAKGILRALLPVLRRPRVADGIARGRTSLQNYGQLYHAVYLQHAV